MRGHVLVSNDTSTGGSTAFFECTGPAQIDGALTAPSVATTTLHPLGASTFTGNVTLPNMGSAGALSTGSLIQFAGTAFTLTLPTPTPGYMLYFINTNDTHTFTIASAGNLNYENPIDTLLINQSSFTVGIAAWGMLIADGTNWWVIYDSNLVSGISGLGLLTDLNAVLTCVVTAGPVYTFTSSASGVWKFNGPVSANNGLSVMNGLSADGVAVGSGGITVSAGGIDVISGSAIFPVASINPSNLNTAFNFLSGLTIQNNSAGTANRFAITDGTSTAHLAVATGTLQCDLGLVIPALALTGGDFFNNTGIHIGSSASSIAGLTIPSHGLNVTGGAIADSLTVGSGGMSTTGGLTIQNNSAGTANRLAITDGTSTSHLAVATGTLHCDLGLVIPSVLINTGGLAVTGGTTTDGLTVGSGGASTSFIGVTSSATTSIDTAGGVRAANGLNITAGTVVFPSASIAQAAVNGLPANTTNIATNTANIATNTANIATNTSAIAALSSIPDVKAYGIVNAASFFNTYSNIATATHVTTGVWKYTLTSTTGVLGIIIAQRAPYLPTGIFGNPGFINAYLDSTGAYYVLTWNSSSSLVDQDFTFVIY